MTALVPFRLAAFHKSEMVYNVRPDQIESGLPDIARCANVLRTMESVSTPAWPRQADDSYSGWLS